MEFVVVVIQEFFNKDRETATQIMLKIHLDGRGVCGVYSAGRGGHQGRPGAWRRPRRPGIRCSASVNRLNKRALEPI